MQISNHNLKGFDHLHEVIVIDILLSDSIQKIKNLTTMLLLFEKFYST